MFCRMYRVTRKSAGKVEKKIWFPTSISAWGHDASLSSFGIYFLGYFFCEFSDNSVTNSKEVVMCGFCLWEICLWEYLLRIVLQLSSTVQHLTAECPPGISVIFFKPLFWIKYSTRILGGLWWFWITRKQLIEFSIASRQNPRHFDRLKLILTKIVQLASFVRSSMARTDVIGSYMNVLEK